MINHENKFIRFTDAEAAQMLNAIAQRERRTIGNTVAILVRQEYARLFSQPREDVRVEESPLPGSTPGTQAVNPPLKRGEAEVE